MFMRSFLILLAVLPWVVSADEQLPALGQPISEQEVGSITVFPDGRGLPEGSGSANQGKEIYLAHCMSCHGVEGKAGINDVLAGSEARTIGSYWPYATTVFDYVRRAMPYHSSGILNAEETYAVVAYLLHINGLVGEHEQVDKDTLVSIEMPNRSQFYSRFDLP